MPHNSAQVPEYQKSKKRHNRNHMCIGAGLQPHKAKPKKEINDDTFRCLQNPGTPEGHRSMTSRVDSINVCSK